MNDERREFQQWRNDALDREARAARETREDDGPFLKPEIRCKTCDETREAGDACPN